MKPKSQVASPYPLNGSFTITIETPFTSHGVNHQRTYEIKNDEFLDYLLSQFPFEDFENTAIVLLSALILHFGENDFTKTVSVRSLANQVKDYYESANC